MFVNWFLRECVQLMSLFNLSRSLVGEWFDLGFSSYDVTSQACVNNLTRVFDLFATQKFIISRRNYSKRGACHKYGVALQLSHSGGCQHGQPFNINQLPFHTREIDF